MFPDVMGLVELPDSAGNDIGVLYGTIFNEPRFDVDHSEFLEGSTFFCFDYLACFDGSRSNIQTNEMVFSSENHNKLLITEYFIFVRKLKAKRQQYLSLGFHPARHALFDTRNCNGGNISLTSKLGFAH
jgi:hypothetical protein